MRFTIPVGTTSSNLPNDNLVYICPECAWGQAVPATIEETERWAQNSDLSDREFSRCLGIRLTIENSLHRIDGRLIPALRD